MYHNVSHAGSIAYYLTQDVQMDSTLTPHILACVHVCVDSLTSPSKVVIVSHGVTLLYVRIVKVTCLYAAKLHAHEYLCACIYLSSGDVHCCDYVCSMSIVASNGARHG